MTDEKIVLDAVIEKVISKKAFDVRLRNGHRMVAFILGAVGDVAWGPGVRVRVELSPYDLSKGRVLGQAPEEAET